MLNSPYCRLLRTLLLSAVCVIPPLAGSSEIPGDRHAKLELLSEEDAVVPGKQLWLGVRVELQDGWHTYWLNPGDSGEAPRIQWHLPEGFEAGEIQWPYPERLSTPPFADYGYQHEALLIVPIRPPTQLREGETAKLAAIVHYLICKDVCIPGQEQLELSLPVKNRASGSSAHELFETTRSRLPQPAPRDWKISAVSAQEEFILDLRGRQLSHHLQFFPVQAEQIENAAAQSTTPIPGGIRLHLKKSTHLLTPVARLRGVIVLGPERAYLLDVPVSQHSKGRRPERKEHGRSL